MRPPVTTIQAPDLEKIKARLLLIDFEDDQVNVPEFSVLDREMPRVKNGRYVIVPFGKLSDGEGNNIRKRGTMEDVFGGISSLSEPWLNAIEEQHRDRFIRLFGLVKSINIWA